MFFPIHDQNPRRRRPAVTMTLIGITLLVWLLVQGMGATVPLASSVCNLGMISGELTGRAVGTIVPLGNGLACVVDAEPAWHTVVTSMFLHADWFHLVGNLWFLWLFGDNVEDALGRAGFVVFYLVCGLAAAAAQLVIDPASPVPMVGASGAISGVMGAYVVLYPHVRVRVIAILIVFLTTFRVPAFVMLGYWFVLQLLGALPQVGNTTSGIAFWAHIGGFLAGVVIAFVVRRPPPLPPAPDGFGEPPGAGPSPPPVRGWY